ncbi:MULTISPECIES: flagellar basal-body rod protein FlgF [unclassified Bradyrhizobium]|uniref:flagellar basal-body rod protein FlgF n=1 Tax=unclassified Bradyrhizobium TaxID=2631580 RepID=UPI00102ECC2E|nr:MULTISPECIES: flagellar basal-body rod protein FlgF [unclassified Bradyrhizobium]MDI4234831.1 flagellar basal-body rod protein FlgF [Bradyrhizobium sp. Arg237L]TAI67225.1 flagellar basal-body rod protein FlgF [Bradyrhizobium sp. Leo170]
MQSALYVSLSAQVAVEKRLETIANNLANMKTTAFRADAVKFETAMSRAASQPVAFSTPGENFISRRPGSVTRTENSLDVAVIGNTWMGFTGPTGKAYTRDGRMQINRTGELQTVSGFPVLDAGGTPIIVDPEGGPLTISRDGTITQNNNQVGVLGLFDIPVGAKLERYGNSGVIPDRAATPVVDFMYTGFQQGFVEESNVDPLSELTQLITASRAFQSVTSLVEGSEGTMQNAIRSLGEPSKA